MEYNFYTAGSNAAETLELSQDAMILDERLKQFMQKNYKNIIYKDYYDKKFLDTMKMTIKQPELFKVFLEQISFSLQEFIHTAVYVCPSVFTTSIIKFIKVNYLKNDMENTNN